MMSQAALTQIQLRNDKAAILHSHRAALADLSAVPVSRHYTNDLGFHETEAEAALASPRQAS